MKRFLFNAETGIFEQEFECQLNPVATQREGRPVYMWPENTTDVAPLAPKENYDIVWQDGAWKYKEQEKLESQEEYKPSELDLMRQKLYEVECNLSRTDYIALKLAEATALGNEQELSELLAKYQEVLENRAEWREQVNNLREEIGNMD